MGYRTVVSFNNDTNWQSCGDLASKIEAEMFDPGSTHEIAILEKVHADTVTLGIISFYGDFKPIAHTYWGDPNKELTLLKSMAAKLGYRVVKKSTPNSIL